MGGDSSVRTTGRSDDVATCANVWAAAHHSVNTPIAETTSDQRNFMQGILRSRVADAKSPLHSLTPGLDLDTESFREFEAECGLGRQDDFLISCVGRTCGSRTSSSRGSDERSLSATGKTSDESTCACTAADQNRSAFSFALKVTADRAGFHILCVAIDRYG